MGQPDNVPASGLCPRCRKKAIVHAQYSYGVYVGIMCRQCAVTGYRDQCGFRPEGQGSPAEYEEVGEQYHRED
jgi:hypothetical protein